MPTANFPEAHEPVMPMNPLPTIFVLVLSILPATSSSADVVREHFNYPVQNDTTGYDSGGTIYRVTTTGTYGSAGDLVVLSWSESLASGTGIQVVSTNNLVFLDSASESGFSAGQTVLLGIADIPGFADTSTGGVFASFFSSPRNLADSSGQIDLGIESGTNQVQFRLLAADVDDNEIATGFTTLGSSLQTFGFTSDDFTDLLQGTSFDETQVVRLGVEFFAIADNSGNVDSFRIQLDFLSLTTIPEPGSTSLLLLVSGIACLVRNSKRQPS